MTRFKETGNNNKKKTRESDLLEGSPSAVISDAGNDIAINSEKDPAAVKADIFSLNCSTVTLPVTETVYSASKPEVK